MLSDVKYHATQLNHEHCSSRVVLKAGMPERPEILKPGMTDIFQACR